MKNPPLFCSVCGGEHGQRYAVWHGLVCSRRCHREFDWRRECRDVGRAYGPDPEAIEGRWCVRYTAEGVGRGWGVLWETFAAAVADYERLIAGGGVTEAVLVPAQPPLQKDEP